MAAPGPPSVRTALVVGDQIVPVVSVDVVNEDGIFVSQDLVELSRSAKGYGLFKWLWGPLGMSLNDFYKGAPASVPLITELQAAIAQPRGKRGSDGKFRDAKGRQLADLLPLTVRGRELLAANNARRLQVNLADAALMQWFVGELWRDLHEPSDGPGGVGGGVPGSSSASGEANASPEDLATILDVALGKIKAIGGVRTAVFEKKNGRFKVRFHAPGKATYHWFRVDKFKQLVAQQNMNMLERHFAMTYAHIRETLDMPLEDPGAESQGSQDMPLQDTAESPRMPLKDAAEDEAESQAESVDEL